MMKKFVYDFNEGNKDMRELLGGKGANLCSMASLGLPVPEGFIITTEACNKYYEENETLPVAIEEEIYNELIKKYDSMYEIYKKMKGVFVC